MRVNWLGGKTSMKSVMQTCFQLVLHCLRWWYSTSFALCFRDDSSIQWRQVLCLCSCLLREGCCWFEGQDHGSQLPDTSLPGQKKDLYVECPAYSYLDGKETSQLGMFLVVTLLLWLWSRSVHHEEYYIQSWGGGWCMPNQSKEALSPLLCVLMFGARFASDLPNQASWRFEASCKVWEIRFLLLFLPFSEFET